MTESGSGHPSKTDDPKASLRAELLDALTLAQQQLETAISELRRNGSHDLARSEAQLAGLVALKQGIASASPAALARLGDQIAAAVSAASAAMQDAISAGGSARSSAGPLADARENARHTVDAVMAGMKDFDPYLQFASPEDERAYRERGRVRLEQIEKEKAKGTTQGDLAAVTLAKQQLLDAGAHGADTSPAWQQRLTALDQAGANLESAEKDQAAKVSPREKSTQHEADLAAAMAALSAAGVTASPSQLDGHGVTGVGGAGRALLR